MFNYKKLIKSRDIRLKILNVFSFVPDKTMLKIQYRIKTGRKLNLKNPRRFTEKLQWYKLYYRDPLMAVCSDKYAVREYVKSCGLEHILNECYGVYDSVSDIDFDSLPNQFVAKDTLGGGGNSVIVCRDKSKTDLNAIKATMQKWLDIGQQKVDAGREWVYCRENHKIIIEKFINSDSSEGGLIDYKFFCFNGKAEYLYVIADRQIGDKAACGIFDSEYRKLDVMRIDEKPLTRKVPRTANFEEMKETAEILAKAFPHARVDLYCIMGETIFGEITFCNGSGYMTFSPDEFDFNLGECFVLPERLNPV